MKIRISSLLLISVFALIIPFNSIGQRRGIPSDKRNFHEEKTGDVHLFNAHDNKKTSPAFKYRNNVAMNVTGSSITTTQVNVDGSGQNILDDAANEPSIAVSPLNKNKMVIGWRQFDNISSNFRQAGWGYTTDAGVSWTFPGKIEPGIFRSDPVLDCDAAGNFYYNSLTNDPTFLCKVFKSNSGGATWNAGTDAAGGDKQWMAIDRTGGIGHDNIYSFWSSGNSSCAPDHFTRSTDGNNSYESCTTVDGDPFFGTMAIGNSGELYIAGVSAQPDNIVVAKSLNAMVPGSVIAWNTPVDVYMDGNINGWMTVNPVGLLGQANIEVDHSTGPGQGNVYVLASLTRTSTLDPADVMFARSTDGGLTWSSPIRINDDASDFNTQWLGTMSVAPNGRIDVVWLDTRDGAGTDSSALYYSYSTDQGTTWSVNEKMSALFDPHVGYPNQEKMGDYFDMVSDSTGAHLAWANTLNGEQDVYYSHIVPQITIGVNEISANASLSVYPNPTHGIIVIKGVTKQSQVEIYSALGEKVYVNSIMKTAAEIDISYLSAGIYILKVDSQNENTTVRKIVKE